MNFLYLIICLFSINFQSFAAQVSQDKEITIDQTAQLEYTWFWAIDTLNDDTIKSLIGKVNVNAQDKYGETALMKIAFKGYGNLFELLLKAPGIDVNAQDKRGTTALMRAIYGGNNNIVKVLLQIPAIKIDMQDETGTTALMIACYYARTNIVKILLDHHANVNIQAKDGTTALAMALVSELNLISRLENIGSIVNYLLDVPGIILTTKNKDGLTPLAWGKKNGISTLYNCIEAKIIELSNKAWHVIQSDDIDALKKINTQIGPDIISYLNESLSIGTGDWLLHTAFAHNAKRCIFFLLQNTKNPHEPLCTKDYKKRFPLELISPSSELFEFFLNLAYGQETTKTGGLKDKSEPSQICQVCSKVATQFCSKCKTAYYCNSECQKADWQNHKHSCQRQAVSGVDL